MPGTKEFSRLPLIVLALAAFLAPLFLVWGCSDECGRAKMVHFASGDSCVVPEPPLESIPEPFEHKVKVTVEGLRIHVVHGNAILNCCLDTIEVDLTHDGRLLMLREKEVVTTPCDCICPFEVEATIEVLLPGTYVLEIYTGIELVWSQEIEV
jgi:hypothetical protein